MSNLQDTITEIKSVIEEASNPNNSNSNFKKQHKSSIEMIILFLVKINSLLDFSDKTTPECIERANNFVVKCYNTLIEAVNHPEIAKHVWKFNGHFFKIVWKNRLCNNLHEEMIATILLGSGIEKLNCDSFDLLEKIYKKRQFISDKEECAKAIISQETAFKLTNYERRERERKRVPKREQPLEFFMRIVRIKLEKKSLEDFKSKEQENLTLKEKNNN